jgi:glutamate--cysteine ligase catalytic subunit
MPYIGELEGFNFVEANMVRRREEAQALCGPDELVISIGNFPRLGCPDFTDPPTKPNFGEGVTASRFFPDAVIYSSHPRFRTLTKNIRERRGERVAINVPILKDVNTPKPFREPYFDEEPAAKDDHIYMDAMGFGMGCCCLQVTFQAVNVNEARWLYDQLTPITPIMLALRFVESLFKRITLNLFH